MFYFICATYNEESEIIDLLHHVTDHPFNEGVCVVDDGSSDLTAALLRGFSQTVCPIRFKVIEHTGLPETVKNHAKEMVPDGAWILMLDADERLSDDAQAGIEDFFASGEADAYDYVYFSQYEIIDGVQVRSFQKCKLFRKESVTFPLNNIHADDQFEGRGTFKEDWIVFHRKSTYKQIKREGEYLDTYKKLLEDGYIDEGRYQWLRALHHYVK